jgi:O-antigen ligase
MANRIALTMVFTLSFASYLAPDLTLSLQIAPLVLFALIVVFRVFFSRDLLAALESLVAIDSLLFVLFVSLLVIIPSMQSEFDKSFAFSIVLSSCLILARLYMAVVPVSDVLDAFFWSGVISVTVFLPLVFTSLLESIRTLSRFTAFSFHPNLLAFVLGGYFCSMVWKFLSGGWAIKLIAAPIGIVCLIVIFFASSRGSILGIIGGLVVVATTWIAHMPRQRRARSLRLTFWAVTLIVTAFIFVQRLQWVEDTYTFMDKVLQLTDAGRGIDSGFTGRVDKWQETVNSLKDGTWLLGHGIRSSDSMPQLIDNSYIVSLYEIGLIPVALIFVRFVATLRRFVKASFTASDLRQAQLFLACALLMVSFLLNNFVARYLFSVGNPYSFLAILFFAAPCDGRASLANLTLTGTPVHIGSTQTGLGSQGQFPT